MEKRLHHVHRRPALRLIGHFLQQRPLHSALSAARSRQGREEMVQGDDEMDLCGGQRIVCGDQPRGHGVFRLPSATFNDGHFHGISGRGQSPENRSHRTALALVLRASGCRPHLRIHQALPLSGDAGQTAPQLLHHQLRSPRRHGLCDGQRNERSSSFPLGHAADICRLRAALCRQSR